MGTTAASKSGKRPATFDHLKKKQPLERRVSIPLTQEASDTYTQASDALERAKILQHPEHIIQELDEALTKARAALDADSVHLLFRSIGRKSYEALIRMHPSTDKQKEELAAKTPPEDDPGYDLEEFPIALIAASCVEPELTPDQVRELYDEWNASEMEELWITALEVNTQRRVADWGKG